MPWIYPTARELVRALARGEITAEAVTDACLKSIAARDPSIQAFLHVDASAALDQARRIDARRQRGEPLGPLAGLPVAVKDCICVRHQPTTCASRILHRFVPPYDAHVIERLRQADAVILGKTNLDEFAMGSTTENSAYQVTRNPWDRERIPGGSSGGSAAAVAADMVPIALGSDTGGSIRQPAGHCGIVGVKPTYGRVSRYGLVAFASSLDQIGPLAGTVGDAALLLGVIAGHDRRDSTSVDRPVPDYQASVDEPVRPLTIGLVREFFGEGLDDSVRNRVMEAVQVFRDLGATVKDVSLPHSRYAVAAYYVIATAEASSNLARYDGVRYGQRAAEFADLTEMYCRTRGQGFGQEVKRRIMLGTYVLSSGYYDAYYLQALKVRRLIQEDFTRAFEHCDVIVGPTSPTPPFLIGAKREDPLAMYLSDVYTISCNLAGIAGMSIPCGFADQLPVGLQVLAPAFAEETLLRVGRMYERETPWHRQRPPIAEAPPAGDAARPQPQ